jgi:hypothetical protein
MHREWAATAADWDTSASFGAIATLVALFLVRTACMN